MPITGRRNALTTSAAQWMLLVSTSSSWDRFAPERSRCGDDVGEQSIGRVGDALDPVQISSEGKP
jgi:hypothetical protein